MASGRKDAFLRRHRNRRVLLPTPPDPPQPTSQLPTIQLSNTTAHFQVPSSQSIAQRTRRHTTQRTLLPTTYRSLLPDPPTTYRPLLPDPLTTTLAAPRRIRTSQSNRSVRELVELFSSAAVTNPSNRISVSFAQNTLSSSANRGPLAIPNNSRLVGGIAIVSGSGNLRNDTLSEVITDDDVLYLYSVDSSAEGRVVEQIDLSLDNQDSSRSTTSSASEADPQEKNNGERKTRKRKLQDSAGAPEKRRNIDRSQPRCSTCETHYDNLLKNSHFLGVANCGHLFCSSCTTTKSTLVQRDCTVCNTKVRGLRKIFL